MRAIRKTHAGPGLELVDIPEPSPGPGEVKIRVLRAGLCGTDLHLQQWDDWAANQVQVPQTIGHEFYGEVVELGPGVAHGPGSDGINIGDRVSVEGHVVCNRCRNCRAGRRHMCIRSLGIGVNRDGAFADFVVVPATNVWHQPSSIDAELGALFDPLGNAVHTAFQRDLAGEDVLITGAGPIGVMAAAIARHAGARNVVITDISPLRLALASGAGATRAVNVATEDLGDVMRELGVREGFDVGLEMSGMPAALNQMIDACRHGATISLLGLPREDFAINWGKVITHMLTIKGIYGREMYDTWYRATFMMETSERLREAVRSVITHRFAPEQFTEAFAAARSGQCGKVIIDFTR